MTKRVDAGRGTNAVAFCGACLLVFLSIMVHARAEVVLHGSGIRLDGNLLITADLGETHGGNLFHSFSVFNVLNGEAATFTGPADVSNVIARVTGSVSDITGLQSSLLDGPVSVAIPGANFYFINPHGIVFGEFGSVDASGSVYLSTADVLRLGNGGDFFADPASPSVLTTADPVAFGFLNANPASVVMNGVYMGDPFTPAPVPSGKTFAIVAGDIDIRDGAFGGSVIAAPGATVSLASVASTGDALLLPSGKVDVDAFATLGNVRLSGGSLIDVGDALTGSGAGTIHIRSGQLTLAPAGLLAQTFGDVDGGEIDIAVRGNLSLETDANTGIISVILAGSYGGLGQGPEVKLAVGGALSVSDGSFVLSENYGAGGAGDIVIDAGRVDVRGQGLGEFTAIRADNFGDAAGPSLRIMSPEIHVLNGGIVGTFNGGAGSGGDATLIADHILVTGFGAPTLSISTETLGGAAGDLSITTRTLELRDGARVSASTSGFGNAGLLSVSASESITIRGDASGIFSATVAFDADVGDAGNAGNLAVSAPLLNIDGGVIDSTTTGDGDAGTVNVTVGDAMLTGGAQIRSFSGGFDVSNNNALIVGTGAAGDVNLVASGGVTIAGSLAGFPSGLLAETRGVGAGGDVNVNAHQLTLADGGKISSSSLGDGLAGNIAVTLTDALFLKNGSIATQAIASDGGNIDIRAPRLIHLIDSQITTSVQSGVGGGGNIFIDPQFVVLQNSQIIANAFGGPGGNITLIANQLIADPRTVISASSALGIDGTVNLDAPDSDVSSGLAVLPDAYFDASRLLQSGCGAARAGYSSMVEVGRGGLPPDPDDYLPSPATYVPTQASSAANHVVGIAANGHFLKAASDCFAAPLAAATGTGS